MGSSGGNSSAITVRVAPADLPVPRARWPAERPMATTRYHRCVVMASVIRLLTSSTPVLLAVSKPKVGVPPGSGRSLSMVFGTCATRRLPPAASASRDAENAVSSPPIVTSASTPSLRSDARQACRRQSGSAAPSSLTVGLAREVRMTEPPWTWIRDTSVMDSGRASSTRPPMRCWKPSMIPRTSHPEFRASIVAAAITEFIPGAGPPPHKIASFTTSSSQPRSDHDKRAGCRHRPWLAVPRSPDDRLDPHGGTWRDQRHERSLDPPAVHLQVRDASADPVRVAHADLVGRAAESPGGGEAGPGRRQHRIYAQPVEFRADPEDPLRDRGEVPGGRSGQPRVLGLAVGGRVRSRDHLGVDVRLAAVDVADLFPGRGIDALVVAERGVTAAGHRLGDHHPRVGVAEDAAVLLVTRRVGGNLAQLEVIARVGGLQQHDAVLGGQPLAHAVQRPDGGSVVEANAAHHAHALRLDENLSFVVGRRADGPAGMVVGAPE